MQQKLVLTLSLLGLLLLLLFLFLRRGGSTASLAENRAPLEQLAEGGIESDQLALLLRAFKREAELEIWGKNKRDETFQLLVTYPICASSGTLGPKRREGDRQVPEGVYYIDRFNPRSQYHLSLGLNYPNASDVIRGDPMAPGSDIFIHGKCVTIGCLPMTDPVIEEIYQLAELARAPGRSEFRCIFSPIVSGKRLRMIPFFAVHPTALSGWNCFLSTTTSGFTGLCPRWALPKMVVTL